MVKGGILMPGDMDTKFGGLLSEILKSKHCKILKLVVFLFLSVAKNALVLK